MASGMETPTPVSSSRTFCVPYWSELVTYPSSKAMSYFGIGISTADERGIFTYSLKGSVDRAIQIYYYRSGEVLFSMKRTPVKWFRRSEWVAFREESTAKDSTEKKVQLLFTVKEKHRFLDAPYLEVFLPENELAYPDFILEGDGRDKLFTIFSSGRPIAEAVRRPQRARYFWDETSTIKVTVCPQVDRAFISGLTTIWIAEEDSIRQRHRFYILLATGIMTSIITVIITTIIRLAAGVNIYTTLKAKS